MSTLLATALRRGLISDSLVDRADLWPLHEWLETHGERFTHQNFLNFSRVLLVLFGKFHWNFEFKLFVTRYVRKIKTVGKGQNAVLNKLAISAPMNVKRQWLVVNLHSWSRCQTNALAVLWQNGTEKLWKLKKILIFLNGVHSILFQVTAIHRVMCRINIASGYHKVRALLRFELPAVARSSPWC